jgi:hypothetical protein
MGAKLPAVDSPFQSQLVGSAGFTIGAEANNVKNVALQLRSVDGVDLSQRGVVTVFLSDDANGDSIVATAPSGGWAIGTDGAILCTSPALVNSVILDGNLAIDAVPEKFKTTQTAVYVLGGVSYTKAATTALVFSAAHVVAATKYGIVLVQINAAGTVTTKVPAATPTTPMTYADAATALAALPAPDTGNVALGYITLNNSASDGSSTGAWVANTDDLTNTSDITAAAFVDATEVPLVPTKAVTVVSESDGDIDFNITHVGAKTLYMGVILPDGSTVMSGAITFT